MSSSFEGLEDTFPVSESVVSKQQQLVFKDRENFHIQIGHKLLVGSNNQDGIETRSVVPASWVQRQIVGFSLACDECRLAAISHSERTM